MFPGGGSSEKVVTLGRFFEHTQIWAPKEDSKRTKGACSLELYSGPVQVTAVLEALLKVEAL